ncbi:MAG TPA: TolC family protein [Bacteroidia bacterium]|jgi:outer membrane protein TolC|nr:TolC family protein [Bacteroidia bacterium]
MKKFLCLFLLTPIFISAQVLQPEDALRIGLQNNYNIVIAKDAMQADSILNAAGEAGMLPTVSLAGGLGINQNNIHQKYANGNEFISPNAGTNTLNASVLLNWTLFDGTKMFVTKEKLSDQQLYGTLGYRTEVLQTSASILLAYYDVIRNKQKLNAVNEVITQNTERLKINEVRMSSGLGAKTEVNQAKIDLNGANEEKFSAGELLDEAKRKLNTLLARDVNTAFDVPDSVADRPSPQLAALTQKMNSANPDLLALKTQVDISKLVLRESRTAYYPKLSAQAGYNFLHTENTAGFSLYNQSYGWQTGLTLSVPLYQAGKTKRQVEVSRLEVTDAESRLQQATLEANLELQNAFSLYTAKSEMIKLEKENAALARENMQLALERLRDGQGTALEVQQAQITLSTTLSRLADLQYELVESDIDLHLIASDL